MNALYPADQLTGYEKAGTLFQDGCVHDVHNASQEGPATASTVEDDSAPHQDASTLYNYSPFAFPDGQNNYYDEDHSETTLAQSSMGNDSTLVDGNDQNYARFNPLDSLHEDSDDGSQKVLISSSPRSTYSASSGEKHNVEFKEVDLFAVGGWVDSSWLPTFGTSFEQN